MGDVTDNEHQTEQNDDQDNRNQPDDIRNGQDVAEAIDSVLGAGTYAAIASDIYDDETYIGPRRPRITQKGKRGPPKGGTKKAMVLALVERDGKAVAYPISAPTADNLKGSIRNLVDKSSTIMTDENRAYIGIGSDFNGGHKTVNHRDSEYVRYETTGPAFVSTNTAESFFARVKRSFIGVHHKMSKKHLHRYVTEAQFKWNSREVSDGARMVEAIKGAEGKRLMYREPSDR